MIRIKNIKIDVENDNLCFLKKKITKKIKVNDSDIIDLTIKKKSIDARNKSEIFYVYDVCLSLKNEREIENNYKLQKEYLDERIEALKEYLRK